MYKNFFSVMYALNIIFQAFFCLALPIGLGLLTSWLLTEYASAPDWIYAPIVTASALGGIISMVKFILSAMSGLERLEKERNSKN